MLTFDIPDPDLLDKSYSGWHLQGHAEEQFDLFICSVKLPDEIFADGEALKVFISTIENESYRTKPYKVKLNEVTSDSDPRCGVL